jgi:hypothetical protein
MKRICAKEKNWGRDTQLDIVWASQTLSDSVGHCLVRSDFVRAGVQTSLRKNELPQIKTKLCRYDIDHERDRIAKYGP